MSAQRLAEKVSRWIGIISSRGTLLLAIAKIKYPFLTRILSYLTRSGDVCRKSNTSGPDESWLADISTVLFQAHSIKGNKIAYVFWNENTGLADVMFIVKGTQ